jgi:hypothetical protein
MYSFLREVLTMKMKRLKNVRSYLILAVLFVLNISAKSPAQTLYGITGGGGLYTINTSTGGATLVGDIGISLLEDGYPQGMAYNPNTGLLYVGTYAIGGLGRMFSVDPSTAESTPFGSWGQKSYAMTYRYVDDLLYRLEALPSTNLISRWDESGNLIDDLGYLQDVTAIQGLSVRPSDGILFGAGYNSWNEDALFTIPTDGDPYSLVPVTQVGLTGTNILALAFWPNEVLLGSDGSNLLSINTSDGTILGSNSFGIESPIVGLAVVGDLTSGPIDVWMKDCLADNGDIPSVPEPPCKVVFKSPDIWIDNNQDMILDAPVYEEINKLKAKIRNRDSGVAQDVSVKFYYRNNSTGLYFPGDAIPIGEDIVNVSPNGQTLASVDWNIPTPPTTGGHWCIGVVLDHTDDPLPSPAPSAKDHNNIAIANIWYIAGREGENEYMSFVLATGGSGGFGLKMWPRDFILDVEVNLPSGWSWEIQGAPVGEPFTLKLGEEREVKLSVHVAEGAQPHSGGSIEVRQVDVATHMSVGGLAYNLYEDQLPPEPVVELLANIVDGYALLSWAEVRKEAKTGLRERVSYYEVLRNGKAAAKVVLDGDPHKPGYQWKDTVPLRGTVTYSLRVVDEGGNVSEQSPEISVTQRGGITLFNWLTWLLLILLLLFFVLFIMKRRSAR